MNQLLTIGEVRGSHLGRMAVNSLKSCPLCRAINAIGNHECFSCTWSGAFDHDPELLRTGVLDLIDRCPELKLALKVVSPPSKKRSLRSRLLSFFRSRPLDIRV
jgi:hypothetical protein